MSYKTDYGRVLGLGSAKDGTHHWWGQRLTAVALLPLTLLFIVPFGRSLGDGYDAVLETYSSTWNAVIAILFFVAGFQHLRLGIQVVIEDYVHSKATLTALLVLNHLLCWGFCIAGAFAVARISFGL